MKKASLCLAALVLSLFLSGCSHLGESTAPKPDPKMFLPKGSTAGGPPASSPTAK